jgi:antitoxin component YwqK of YwqJK toxin-antitoxin module
MTRPDKIDFIAFDFEGDECTHFLYFSAMKLPCLLLALLPAFALRAQKTQFYDFNWKETNVAHARFYSVMQQTDSGWRRLDYYVQGPTLQMAGLYEDSACKIGSGNFVYAYPDGKTETRGRYLHGKRQGLWTRWHPNGMMADSTVFENGNPVGTKMAWYTNGYPSDSAKYNADGSGVEVKWFDNGNPSSAGVLAPGYKPHGRWKFFHKNGQVSAIELYDNGKLLEKQYYDESGQAIFDTTNTDRKAEFKGGTTAWLKYLEGHLNFPQNYQIVNSDEAAVVVTMTVDEDGKVQDAFISTPFFPPFEKEALFVIRHSPLWQPARNHNRTVAAVFSQPVVFRDPE